MDDAVRQSRPGPQVTGSLPVLFLGHVGRRSRRTYLTRGVRDEGALTGTSQGAGVQEGPRLDDTRGRGRYRFRKRRTRPHPTSTSGPPTEGTRPPQETPGTTRNDDETRGMDHDYTPLPVPLGALHPPPRHGSGTLTTLSPPRPTGSSTTVGWVAELHFRLTHWMWWCGPAGRPRVRGTPIRRTVVVELKRKTPGRVQDVLRRLRLKDT